MKKFGSDSDADDSKSSASRSDSGEFFRTYALEDIHIVRAAQGGDGRTVEAYAAVFNDPAEIHDYEGHYIEVIDPAAFNQVPTDHRRSRAGFGPVKVHVQPRDDDPRHPVGRGSPCRSACRWRSAPRPAGC